MTQISVSLSDDLAAKAQEAGLLEPARLEQLLEGELRKKAADFFSEASRRMQEAIARGELEPLSEEEIVEEVRAVRAERRAQAIAR